MMLILAAFLIFSYLNVQAIKISNIYSHQIAAFIVKLLPVSFILYLFQQILIFISFVQTY